jgi:hypothetical protein
MSEAPLEFTIAKLDVHLGDTVVFRLNRPITFDLMQDFQAYLERVLPEGVKALIVDQDTEIAVMLKPRFSHGLDRVHAWSW